MAPSKKDTSGKALGPILEEAARAGPDRDPVSEWYQEQVSRETGRRTGQVYTPPRIAYLMARLALSKGVRKVLDPACGCGTFLRAVVLAARADDGLDPEDLELTGLETQERAALLAGLNLVSSMKGTKVKDLRISVKDFFDLDPDEGMDLVLGNPPYIRQELMGSKEDIRRKLVDRYGTCTMSRRVDLYVHFIEHATRFLKEGGLLALIIPDKWTDVGYGREVKRFLLEHYCLDLVVRFPGVVFERAEIDTVFVLFRRCRDPEERSSTVVRFLSLDGSMTVDQMIGRVKGDGRSRKVGTVEVPQSGLEPRARWSHHLRAPPMFKEMIGSGKVVRLSTIEGVVLRRGLTTNLTRFFFPSQEDVERYGVPERFLAPAVRSPKDLDGLVLDRAPGRLLLVPGNVRSGKGLSKVIAWGNKRIWGKDGGKGVRVRELPSFRGKGDDWFRLKVAPPADILVPKFVREGRPRFIWNRGSAHASDTFQTISVPRRDLELLQGCLNSVLGALSCEVVGRVEGKGLLQLMTYELGEVLVPDLGPLGARARKDIVSGYRTLVSDGDPGYLDMAVIRALGVRPWRKILERVRSSYDSIYRDRLARASAWRTFG